MIICKECRCFHPVTVSDRYCGECCIGETRNLIAINADITGCCLYEPVEPVRHGRWEDNGEDKYICSSCKHYMFRWFGKRDYCPNCGAKMDENESMFTDTFSQCDNCHDWNETKCKSGGHGCEGGGSDNG